MAAINITIYIAVNVAINIDTIVMIDAGVSATAILATIRTSNSTCYASRADKVHRYQPQVRRQCLLA